jgi:Nitroreductase family.
LIWLAGGIAVAEAQESIKLLPPNLSSGKTVLQALNERKSERVFGPGELNRRQLSEVLWAAAGVNRTLEGDKMGRTTPSSHNDQAIDTYAFTKSGVYKYNHLKHELVFMFPGDHRAVAGPQSYVATAPLSLILVADLSRVTGDTREYQLMSVSMDAGHMSANVYLYGASAELRVICRSTIEREELRALLKLSDHFVPLLGLTVGQAK